MNNQVTMGMNRTGAQMAPSSVDDAKSYARARLGEGRRDGQASAALHADYIWEADAVGSVPIPGTLKGVAGAVASKLKGAEPSVLLDKLGERLAFERTGVRLYEALITKLSAAGEDERSDAGSDINQAELRSILEDEESHFRLLSEAIRTMGADPTAMTPAADVAGVNAAGWLQVINDPRTTVAQALTTMLSAELADGAGWELLIELATAAGYDEMAESFAVAEQAERRHAQLVKGWLRRVVIVGDGG